MFEVTYSKTSSLSNLSYSTVLVGAYFRVNTVIYIMFSGVLNNLNHACSISYIHTRVKNLARKTRDAR